MFLFARRHAAEILLLCFPLFLLALNPEVLSNRLGDVDTWFYFGHFTSFADYRGTDAVIGHNYYQTRLPFLFPGYFIFSVFSETWAKVIFAWATYAVVILSFLYTLNAHFPKKISIFAAALLASDIFFVRAFTWNYVDGCILAYQGLTFACLTRASKSEAGRSWWVGASAFMFTSMAFVHLGSAVLLIPILGYAFLCLNLLRSDIRTLLRLTVAAVVGVVVCQVFYGVLNVLIWHSRFLFVMEQVAVGRQELESLWQWVPVGRLFVFGDWLSLHIAVWILSVVALASGALGIIQLPKFHKWCFGSIAITYLLLCVLDYNRLSVFLSRSGLYASFFVYLSYMAVACVASLVSPAARLLAVVLSLLALFLRLSPNVGPSLAAHDIPAWIVGVVLGVLLIAAYQFRNRQFQTVVFCLLAVPTLFIDWRFDRDDGGVYKAHQIIRLESGTKLPRILYEKTDPLAHSVFRSIVASFTERAWWLHGEELPDLPIELWNSDNVFILSSKPDIEPARAALFGKVEEGAQVSLSKIETPRGNYWIAGFKVLKGMGLPPSLAKFQRKEIQIPAAELPTLVGARVGDSRVANSTDTKRGILTYGPYANMLPGVYDITIHYGPSEGPHTWDVGVLDSEGPHNIANGAIPPTSESNAKTVIQVTLTQPVKNFEVRTYFLGEGQLAVHSIGIARSATKK